MPLGVLVQQVATFQLVVQAGLRNLSVIYGNINNNAEFEKFYSASIDTALELIQIDREELENNVLRYM